MPSTVLKRGKATRYNAHSLSQLSNTCHLAPSFNAAAKRTKGLIGGSTNSEKLKIRTMQSEPPIDVSKFILLCTGPQKFDRSVGRR